MSETKNYGLYITEDSSERFKDWREKMNGETDSNMVKIDAVLAEKANLSQSINFILPADSWVDDDSVCFQTVSIEGPGAEQNGVIGVSQDINAEQLEAVCSAGLTISGQSEGSLTITATVERPSCDIPVTIILLG